MRFFRSTAAFLAMVFLRGKIISHRLREAMSVCLNRNMVQSEVLGERKRVGRDAGRLYEGVGYLGCGTPLAAHQCSCGPGAAAASWDSRETNSTGVLQTHANTGTHIMQQHQQRRAIIELDNEVAR